MAEEIKNEYGLEEEEIPKLARLSLFDIFILCGKFTSHPNLTEEIGIETGA